MIHRRFVTYETKVVHFVVGPSRRLYNRYTGQKAFGDDAKALRHSSIDVRVVQDLYNHLYSLQVTRQPWLSSRQIRSPHRGSDCLQSAAQPGLNGDLGAMQMVVQDLYNPDIDARMPQYDDLKISEKCTGCTIVYWAPQQSVPLWSHMLQISYES